MAYDAREIANWFIERGAKAGRPCTIMSLLKLAYIAHGWYLEMYDKPLFHNKIKAWQYGPVVVDIYRAFKKQGTTPREIDGRFPVKIEPADQDFLEQIYNMYGNMPPFHLSELTHESGGPWEMVRKRRGWYARIPNDLIRAHYIVKRYLADRKGKE